MVARLGDASRRRVQPCYDSMRVRFEAFAIPSLLESDQLHSKQVSEP